MNIHEILELQPSLEKDYQEYCLDGDDSKFDRDLARLGLVRDGDGNIEELT